MRLKLLFALSYMMLCPIILMAQQPEHVGNIERISEKGQGVVASTSSARLFRTGFSNSPNTQDPLLLKDILELFNSDVYLDLRFRNTNTRMIAGNSEFGIPAFLNEEGIYEITRYSTDQINRLQLSIQKGRMVIEHVSGQLEVIAVDIRTSIIGTTVLFDVSDDGSTAVVFLRKGTITFPDFNITSQGKNKFWLLTQGGVPREVKFSNKDVKEYKRAVKHNARVVWRPLKPVFWKRPAFWIPATAFVAGGAIICARDCGGGGGDNITGSVVVDLP